MRILCSVVLIFLLEVFDARHCCSFCRVVALQLVRDDHTRDISQPLQKFAKELLCRFLISSALDQNIQYVAILVYCPPYVMNASIDLEEHFIQVPAVTWPRTTAAQTVRISLAKL